MDDRREREMIQKAVDTTLSGLQGNPWRVQLVLQAAQLKGEKQPVKRKLSVTLAVALALVLTTVTALAVGLSNYFAGFKALESQYGDLADWPASAQVELVQVMLDSGVLSVDDVPGWQELEGADRDAAAKAAVESYFGDMIFVDTYNIMARILGPIEQWTDEQRALYTELLVQYGEQKNDSPYYMVPTGSDLNREQALQKAKAYIAGAFALDVAYLDTLPATAYFYAAAYNSEGLPADEPFWDVCIGEGAELRWVCMTRSGELLSMSGLEQ